MVLEKCNSRSLQLIEGHRLSTNLKRSVIPFFIFLFCVSLRRMKAIPHIHPSMHSSYRNQHKTSGTPAEKKNANTPHAKWSRMTIIKRPLSTFYWHAEPHNYLIKRVAIFSQHSPFRLCSFGCVLFALPRWPALRVSLWWRGESVTGLIKLNLLEQ